MPKVYCVTEPVTYRDGEPKQLFDITPATKFGDIEILAKHNHNMFASAPMIRYFRDKLANFSDDDYILPVGDPVIIGAVTAVAASMNQGRVKLLKWDKRERKYLPISIDIYGNAL